MRTQQQRVACLTRACDVYRWQPVRVAKVRGVFRVETGTERFALKPLTADRERLVFLNKVHQHLLQHDYAHLLPWLKTKFGEPFYRDERTAFYATPWFGKEWSRAAALSDRVLIQSVAEIHRLTENTVANDRVEPTLMRVAEQWQTQIQSVQSYAEAARKREYASPFDNALLAAVDELERAAAFAVNGLNKMHELERKKPFRRVFCHRRIHPHNLVYDQETWKWIDFSHAGVDVPVRDLAAYMRNFPLVEGSDEEERLEEWEARLKVYEATYSLHLREKQLLCVFLAYPSHVYKLLDHYYRRQRSRDEMFYVQKLQETMHQFRMLKRVTKFLWPRSKSTGKKK